MTAIVFFLAFQALGLITIRFLLPRLPVLDRIWLGMSLGLLEMMWLPALFAFAGRFDLRAHWLALMLGTGLTAGCWFLRDSRPVRGWDRAESTLGLQMLAVVLPLTVLGGYLQYTHAVRIDEFGNWNVGQSTYGDLPMHMSFITGLAGKHFPADYPFLPGQRLSYPFLTDTLSTSFYLAGCSLQLSIAFPGTFMMLLCYMGVMALGREMTAGRKTVVLAALLFFLNGGLGFLYDFDQAAGYNAEGGLTVTDRLRAIMEGYYKTPTNQPEPNNLRWSNVIVDLMIPQRTILGGWSMGIPCFYLLETLYRPDCADQGGRGRGEILLGVWAGALPLIHTHTFVALALCSAGTMSWDLVHTDRRNGRTRGGIAGRYLIYAGTAAVIALPQLVCFTFAQTFQADGNSQGFLRFQFNWVNNPGGQGMRDFYVWFYVKNIGIPFLMLILAAFEKNPKQRRLFSGMIPIVLAAELIRFQPNEYDNNKLFYLAWMIGCMIVSNWAALVWRMLKGLRSRAVIAAGTAVLLFLSAGLSIARECVSSYQAFDAESVEAGMYVRDNTEEDAMFLTGTQHLNPVDSIAGRSIVCGPDLWLYWHGFNTQARKLDLLLFYEEPGTHQDILEQYGVDYIYVSSYERNSYDVDEEALEEMFPVVFENGEATIYQVRKTKE